MVKNYSMYLVRVLNYNIPFLRKDVLHSEIGLKELQFFYYTNK